MDKQKILVIDVGSFQIKAYLTEINAGKAAFVKSLLLQSKGFYSGKVADVEELAEALRGVRAGFAGLTGHKTVVGVSGMALGTHFALGSVPLPDGCVSEADLRQISRSNALTTKFDDCEILHIVPKNYRLDGCVRDDAPLGKRGKLLECECSAVTIDKMELALLKRALVAAAIQPDYIVANLFAIYDLLNRYIGDRSYLLLNIGSDNTEAVLCENKKLMRFYSVPAGGRSLTESVAKLAGIDFFHAEALKRFFSTWNKDELYGKEQLIDCSYENSQDKNVQYDVLCDMIENEMRNIVKAIHEKIGIDLIDREIEKVYFTGGCSFLPNAAEQINKIFELEPVFIQIPSLKREYVHPDNIAAYGAASYIGRQFVPQPGGEKTEEPKSAKPQDTHISFVGRLKRMLNL